MLDFENKLREQHNALSTIEISLQGVSLQQLRKLRLCILFDDHLIYILVKNSKNALKRCISCKSAVKEIHLSILNKIRFCGGIHMN